MSRCLPGRETAYYCRQVEEGRHKLCSVKCAIRVGTSEGCERLTNEKGNQREARGLPACLVCLHFRRRASLCPLPCLSTATRMHVVAGRVRKPCRRGGQLDPLATSAGERGGGGAERKKRGRRKSGRKRGKESKDKCILGKDIGRGRREQV